MKNLKNINIDPSLFEEFYEDEYVGGTELIKKGNKGETQEIKTSVKKRHKPERNRYED